MEEKKGRKSNHVSKGIPENVLIGISFWRAKIDLKQLKLLPKQQWNGEKQALYFQ